MALKQIPDFMPETALFTALNLDYYNCFVIVEEKPVIQNAYTYEENSVLYCAGATQKGVYCYTYCLNNPLKYIDPSGQVIRLANNYAGAMENLARIAATSLGGDVVNSLINRNETYTLRSTFLTISSSYNKGNGNINYVGNPWLSEIPCDGGALTSMTAMGHEMFHAYDYGISDNSKYNVNFAETRSVSFANYLREAYSLSPLREQYGSIRENLHQFSGNEKISNFTTLGNNSDKTTYGYSYTTTKTIVESYATLMGMKIPTKIRIEVATQYMTVSRDKNNNASYQKYNSMEEYNNAISNW